MRKLLYLHSHDNGSYAPSTDKNNDGNLEFENEVSQRSSKEPFPDSQLGLLLVVRIVSLSTRLQADSLDIFILFLLAAIVKKVAEHSLFFEIFLPHDYKAREEGYHKNEIYGH